MKWSKREERRFKQAKAVPLQIKACRHQRRAIDGYFQYGIEMSELADHEDSVHVEYPAFDATPKQFAAWVCETVRYGFWEDGTTCQTCGHVATGPLTEHTPEDVKRWGIEMYGEDGWSEMESLQSWEAERADYHHDASEAEGKR